MEFTHVLDVVSFPWKEKTTHVYLDYTGKFSFFMCTTGFKINRHKLFLKTNHKGYHIMEPSQPTPPSHPNIPINSVAL